MTNRIDLNWLRKQLRDQIGMTPFEAGHLICSSMITGHLSGLAPVATRYPKLSVRSHLTAGDGLKRNFAIPPELWRHIDIDWALEDACFNFQTDDSTWIIHKIEVDRICAHEFMRSQDPLLLASLLVTKAVSKENLRRKGKGGRPSLYDWDKCRVEAIRWMTQEGRPKYFERLYEYMDAWYDCCGPRETELKKHLRPIYNDFPLPHQPD